jgi:hypothetical protein
MKVEHQNYAVIMPIESSYIELNNRKTNNIQKYDTVQNYRILHKIVQRLSQRNLKCRAIAILKSPVKENSDLKL